MEFLVLFCVSVYVPLLCAMFGGLIKTQNSYLLMYPINHSHPLRPCWPVLSPFLSEALLLFLPPCDWMSTSIFPSGVISLPPARAVGTVCTSLSASADPLTSGELSERSQSGPVSNGTFGTAQSDAITVAVISGVSAWSRATRRSEWCE